MRKTLTRIVSIWVRNLTGKTRVPYHPPYCEFEARRIRLKIQCFLVTSKFTAEAAADYKQTQTSNRPARKKHRIINRCVFGAEHGRIKNGAITGGGERNQNLLME